ncbi:MAG: DUF898 family protein [Pseudomonadota bacterium]
MTDAIAADVQPGPEPSPLEGSYLGQSGELFRLALVTSFLTLITLGIYRFWGTTRIRRYVWSSITSESDSFEYTGTPVEKLLGFLLAVVVLAVSLGLIQLGLFFAGLSVFAPGDTPTDQVLAQALLNLSFLLLLPLWFFAMYRAYRYRMGRTRWRGIRFGVEDGAWGYAVRALGYGVLTVLTLGLLAPLMTFKLEKYKADRTWFGNARFTQHGRWQMLFPALKVPAVGLGIILLGFILIAADAGVLGVLTSLGGSITLMVGIVRYRSHAFKIMTQSKILGENVEFGCDLDPGEVARITIWGGIAAGVLTALIFAIASGVIAVVSGLDFALLTDGVNPNLDQTNAVILAVSPLVGTLLALLVYSAMILVFVHQPVLAHTVNTTYVRNPIALISIKQRGEDLAEDADGFADALDVGGAF